MGKGRRIPTSRSDLYLGTYGQPGSLTEEFEFREEDVWSTIDREEQGGSRFQRSGTRGDDGSRTASIPRDSTRHMGGLSSAFEKETRGSSRIVLQHGSVQESGSDDATPRRQQMATSAPVYVPDWNRILRVNSVESIHESGDVSLEQQQTPRWDPPHEYLARSRKSAATSVFEGVGRTLKGREMSRLRDAVWSQTGFFG